MREGITIGESFQEERDPLEQFLKDWFAAMLVFATISCLGCVTTKPEQNRGTNQVSGAAPAPRLGDWILIRTNPPTYWPKWLPRDYPAGQGRGEWVLARDSLFFVPDELPAGSKHTRSSLINEALAMRTDKEKFQESARNAGNVALVITAPANPVAWFSGCAP